MHLQYKPHSLRSKRGEATPHQPHCVRRIPVARLPNRNVHAQAAWKTFGPTADYSDGDAQYFDLTSRLSDQYEWFAPKQDDPESDAETESPELGGEDASFGLTPKQIATLGLTGPQRDSPDPASLSSRAYLRGDKFDLENLGSSAVNVSSKYTRIEQPLVGRTYQGARAAYGDYPKYPEGRPVFLPEAERYGTPPDLPSLLLSQRVIYISMPFVSSVTELVVAQCYYLDCDEKNRNKPIYVYLNSTGCINEQNKAISADNEFYAMWASLGLTRAPLYTGVTWKAQNQAAVLLSAGAKGHRYCFPHAKISTSPPVLNRVFGPTADAQLQASELEYSTKYYAAILARSTGKTLLECENEYLSRKRYFSVKQAFEEGLVDKLVPGYKSNRVRKMMKDKYGNEEKFVGAEKPKFRFAREAGAS